MKNFRSPIFRNVSSNLNKRVYRIKQNRINQNIRKNGYTDFTPKINYYGYFNLSIKYDGKVFNILKYSKF